MRRGTGHTRLCSSVAARPDQTRPDQTRVELMHWLRWKRLECFVMTMRDKATDAFSAGWNDDPPDASTWELVPPPGEGWFLGSVHPREDGPECYWFRQPVQK